MELLIFTAVTYSHTGRGVAVCNVLGAYLRANLDEEFIMILEGCLSELTEMVAT